MLTNEAKRSTLITEVLLTSLIQPLKEKFEMKKLLALLMAVAMLVSIVACGGSEKEEDVLDTKNPILNATANLFNKFANEGGTISLSAEGEALDMLEDEFGIAFESLEFKTDTEKVLATLNGKLGDTDLSESIYYGGKDVVVNSPAILGGAYGINLGTLEEDFEDSVFGPDGDYALPEETMDQFEEVFGMLEGIMNGEAGEMIPGLNVEELSATIGELSTKLINEINSLYPSEVTEKDGYTITTITVTSEKFDELFDVIAELLEEKDVQDMFDSINDAVSEFAAAGADIPFDELPDLVRHYGEMLTDATDEYGIEATCVAYIKVSDDGLDTEISMTCEVSAEEYDLEGSIEYVVTEKIVDSKDLFEHTMTAELDVSGLFEEGLGDNAAEILGVMEEGMLLETKWDKKKGDITMVEEMGGEEMISLEGNLELSNTEMTFVFEKAVFAGMLDTSEYIDSVTLKITAGKPSGLEAPNYVNVLAMSKGDLVDFVDMIEENLDELGLGGRVEVKDEEAAKPEKNTAAAR